jgi:hypothetical protein
LNVSEQQSEPISGETGLVGTGPAAPELSPANAPVTAQASVESPMLAPEQEETAPKPEAPKVEAPKAEAPKVEAAKPEAPKVEAPKVEAAKPEEARPEAPRFPGKLMIMSPADRAWNGDRTASKAEAEKSAEPSGKPRMAAMAAVVALATVAGALGGALATAGLGHFLGGEQAVAAVAKDSALEASVARIDADIVALKASVEHTSRMGMSQFNKASDRLDKVEKAQAEPAAKLAKLSEAVDKLRATAPAAVAAATPVAAREVTGSVTPAAAAAASARTEVGRLPTVEGWTLRDVANGGALIESRRGIYEVYAGDPVPGVGRVDAIRKQDGRWVVVTSKGLIVAR